MTLPDLGVHNGPTNPYNEGVFQSAILSLNHASWAKRIGLHIWKFDPGNPVGMLDLYWICAGRSGWIELKHDTAELRIPQRTFLKRLSKAGIPCHVVVDSITRSDVYLYDAYKKSIRPEQGPVFRHTTASTADRSAAVMKFILGSSEVVDQW